MSGRGRSGKGRHSASTNPKPNPHESGSTESTEQLDTPESTEQIDTPVTDNANDPFELDTSDLTPDMALMVTRLQKVIRYEVLKSTNEVTTQMTSCAQSIKNVTEKVDKLDRKIEDVIALQDSVAEVKAATHVIKTETLPNIIDHMNNMMTHLALQNMDLNMHRRKWSLIIQGLPGKQDENSDDTRKAVLDMAKKNLKLKDTKDTPLKDEQLAACHRLQSAAGSAVIARFVDLKQRDRWLAHAKNLSNSQISMSVDVPPCLRKAKQQLMALRKDLAPEAKKRSFVKHLPVWPYLLLHRKGEAPIHHTFSKADIISQAIKLPEEESFVFKLPTG